MASSSAKAHFLDRAENLLAAGPKLPTPLPTYRESTDEFRAGLAKMEMDFTQAMSGWRRELAAVRLHFKENLKEQVRTSRGADAKSLRDLHQLIVSTRKDNAARQILHYVLSLSFEKLEDEVAVHSESDAKFVREIAERILNETTLERAARGEFLEFLEKVYHDKSYVKVAPTSASLRAAIENCEKAILGADRNLGEISQLNVVIDRLRRFGLPQDFAKDGEIELANRKAEIERYNHGLWVGFNKIRSFVLSIAAPQIVEMLPEMQKTLIERERALRREFDLTKEMVDTIAASAASEELPEQALRDALEYRIQPKLVAHRAVFQQLREIADLLEQIDSRGSNSPTAPSEFYHKPTGGRDFIEFNHGDDIDLKIRKAVTEQ